MNLKKTVVLFTLLLCSHFSVNASQQTIKIKTIGISPYGIIEQDKLSGTYYELANLIVSNAGYKFSNKIAPYARIVKSIKNGNTDLSIMFRYPELEDYVDYIVPLPSKSVVVIGLKGQKFPNIASLSGKEILYLRGAKFNQKIDSDKTIIKHLVSDFVRGIKMLEAGRADAIIGPMQSIQRAALEFEKENNRKIIFSDPLIFDARTPWIQMSKKSSSYLDADKLKQSFLELQEDDIYNTLRAKYAIYGD